MGQPFVGEIRMFAGNFPPQGWEFCDGQTMAISENETLYQLIGTTFGGDGQQTFNLPDLRGRLPMHQNGTTTPMGASGGVESVVLSTQQIPAHGHAATASAQPATDTSPAGAVPAAWSDAGYATGAPTGTLAAPAVGTGGGGVPHENRSPYTALSFIISLYGVFPPPA